MNTLQQDFAMLIGRDLNQLIENIQAMPEDLLWTTPDGITNSCGVLVQHLAGNLNHYMGKGIAENNYIRDRKKEFTTTHLSKTALIQQVEDLKQTLEQVFDKVTEEDLEESYPLDFPLEVSKKGALLHLYGHLNYHLGQINYLRRILDSD